MSTSRRLNKGARGWPHGCSTASDPSDARSTSGAITWGRQLALPILCALWLLASGCHAAAAAQPQTRCGWFENPTPGNASLHDREGEWIIAIQGDYEAQGDWPQFKDSQWVSVNRSYGHGCACMKAVVDAKTRQVVSIISAKARPLGACRRDRALKEPAG